MNSSFRSLLNSFKQNWRALALSGANQMIGSLTNFVVVLYLVRVMEKSEFGFYSLGFALMLMIAGLISSLIIVQFVVNLPDLPKIERVNYAMHHSIAVFLLGMIPVILGVLIDSIQMAFIIGEANVQQIILPCAAATFFYSQRDFLVRVAYSERRESIVLISALAVSAGMAAFFIVEWYLKQSLSASRALYGIATGQMTGCVIGLFFLKFPYSKFNFTSVLQVFKDSWQGGRWNILTNVLYNLRTQAHNFVVPPLLGMVALAEMNAARVLVTPAVMAIPPLMQILMPRLGEKRKEGITAIKHYALLSIGVLAAFSLLYTLLLIVLLPWALPLALGEAYQHVGYLVMAWCLVSVFLALRNGLTMVLQVIRAFRDLFFVNVIAAAVAILLVIALCTTFDSLGAIIALAIAEIVLCFSLVKLLQSKLAEQVSFSGGR